MAALADSNTTTDAALHALQETASTHGVELSIHRVAKGEEIATVIDMAQASGATALNVLASPMLTPIVGYNGPQPRRCVCRSSINGRKRRRRRLCRVWTAPLADARDEPPDICKGPPWREACRSAGRTANKIRAGNQPQNREGARYHFPNALLVSADEVIE